MENVKRRYKYSLEAADSRVSSFEDRGMATPVEIEHLAALHMLVERLEVLIEVLRDLREVVDRGTPPQEKRGSP